MTISAQDYFRFWLNNTGLAVGFILLSIFLPPFGWIYAALSTVHPAIYPIGLFLFLQHFIFRHFIGGLRGYFEFAVLAWNIEKISNRAINSTFGIGSLLILKFDETSTFGLVRDNFYKKIFSNEKLMSAQEVAFSIRVRVARSLLKQSDPSDAVSHLKEAIEISPSDIVANYLMGSCHEELGNAFEAITAYRVALTECPNTSKRLEPIFLKKINRVKSKGPSKKSPMPGLKFVIY